MVEGEGFGAGRGYPIDGAKHTPPDDPLASLRASWHARGFLARLVGTVERCPILRAASGVVGGLQRYLK